MGDNLSLFDIIKMKLEEALVSKSLLDNLANQGTKQVTLAEVIANSVAIYVGQNQEIDANKLDIQIDTVTGQKFPEIVIKQGASENELLSDVKFPGAIKMNLTFQVQIPKIPENIDQLVSDITKSFNTVSEMADNSNSYFDNRDNLVAPALREEELLDEIKTPLPPFEKDIRSGLLELDNWDPNLPNSRDSEKVDNSKFDYDNLDNPVIPVIIEEQLVDEINTTMPPCVDIRSALSELDNCDPNSPNPVEDLNSENFGDYRLPPLVSINAELDETFQEEASFAADLSKVDYYAFE